MHQEYFEQEEYRDWYDEMSPRLLTMDDVLRFQVGSPMVISPHPDSLGRSLGAGDESTHNIDHWREVLANDFFFLHVTTRGAVEDVVDRMRKIGFTGIGVYTDTVYNGRPHPMFHGDVRPDRKMGAPATWGRVKGKYTSLMAAIQSLEN